MYGNCLWGFFGQQVPPVSPSLKLEHENLNCFLEQNTHKRAQTQCSPYLPYKLILNRNSLLLWDYCLLPLKHFHLPLQLLTCNFSAFPTEKVIGSCLCEHHKAGDAKTPPTNTWRKGSGRLNTDFQLTYPVPCQQPSCEHHDLFVTWAWGLHPKVTFWQTVSYQQELEVSMSPGFSQYLNICCWLYLVSLLRTGSVVLITCRSAHPNFLMSKKLCTTQTCATFTDFSIAHETNTSG